MVQEARFWWSVGGVIRKLTHAEAVKEGCGVVGEPVALARTSAVGGAGETKYLQASTNYWS